MSPPKVVSRVGTGVTCVGVCNGSDNSAGVNHGGFSIPPMDDVLSSRHEPVCVENSSDTTSDQTSCIEIDLGTLYPIYHPVGKTLENSVQSPILTPSLKECGLEEALKDCSLQTEDQQARHEVNTLGLQCPMENDILTSMLSPLGKTIVVYASCLRGECDCKYFIGDIPCQLKPCRFAAVILSNPNWADKYLDLLWNVTEGFPIVDEEVPSYRCKNYSSILEVSSKEKMDKIIRSELSENVISMVDYTPHCIHALGAVPKPNGGIRPITDCSRPSGISVNNYCSTLFKEFSYKSVDNVVEILKWGMYMSVVDIKSAYRAVPIRQEHRKFMGFESELDGAKQLFVDNRLSFGLRLGPQYFQHISNFVHDVLLNVYNVETINYLDDFITVARSYESCLNAQNCILKVLRGLGFYVAYDKVSPPATCTIFLGIEIDSVEMVLRLPEAKVNKLNTQLDRFIEADRISKVDLESLGGLLSHCAHLVRGGRTFCRRLYNLYKEVCSKGYKTVKIPDVVKADLRWWRVFCKTFNGVSPINNMDYPDPMVSDASFKGFGVYMGSDWAAGS